jgi:hypothetical protein
MKVKVVIEKEIDHCYHSCPFFELDGGPGPVMYCNHPFFDGADFTDRFIISHPKCDTGFPDKCPLSKEEGE